jgi:hypothetical protein
MSHESAGYYSTLQHVSLLAAKRERLLDAQMDAESQFLTAVARDYKRGVLDEVALAHVYLDYRDASATAGHSKRWNEIIPIAAGRLDRLTRNFPRGHDRRTWQGSFPLDLMAPTPLDGMSVVYLLFDSENDPCYVGSTMHLRNRLRQHAKAGKEFVNWQAHSCADRASAYDLEREWLTTYKPYMNKRTA